MTGQESVAADSRELNEEDDDVESSEKDSAGPMWLVTSVEAVCTASLRVEPPWLAVRVHNLR